MDAGSFFFMFLSFCFFVFFVFVFFQAEDGIRDLVRSRGLGDVYKRQALGGDGRFGVIASGVRELPADRSLQVAHVNVESGIDRPHVFSAGLSLRNLSLIHI